MIDGWLSASIHSAAGGTMSGHGSDEIAREAPCTSRPVIGTGATAIGQIGTGASVTIADPPKRVNPRNKSGPLSSRRGPAC